MSFSHMNIKHLTDKELVTYYKNSADKIYVGELYKRYSHLVLGMCISYFKDKEIAKDMVLQIFEKLFVELRKREVESFKAWLTFVVRNYCISELRKFQTKQKHETGYQYEVQMQMVAEDADLLRLEEKKLEELSKAMNHLNPFQKRCNELFYLKDMSYAQIVELTGFSVNEVKSYIQNGKRNLKLLMSEPEL